MVASERHVIGWDVGGAHVKACLLQRGEVVDVAQWACPLWQGMEKLAPVLQAVCERWPGLRDVQHAVTMTGEMVDLFAHREEGVRRIAAELARLLPGLSTATEGGDPDGVYFFAGDAGWCRSADVAAHWEAIASANWLATARHVALHFGDGFLVDVGSTTTDLIAFNSGRVMTAPRPAEPAVPRGDLSSPAKADLLRSTSRTDAQRLASGELVYQGVVRTPLCALAQRIAWRGTPHNVMNEFFSTSADVYRVTGELDPAHDLYPSADNAAKDLPATQQRLARMVGLDQREGSAGDWLAFARSWREAQVAEIGSQLRRVMAAHAMGREAVIVSAGCGDFLVPDVLAHATAGTADAASAGYRLASYGRDVARVAAPTSPSAAASRATVQAWAQVCAPCVATATLFDREQR